jgi:hypothetical protein
MSWFDRSGRRLAAMVAAMAGIVLFAGAPAQGASATTAVCTVVLPSVSITPAFNPFVLTPATGTIATLGRSGSVICIGEIDGDRVTGPGTTGISYTYSSGTCASHVGLGTGTWVIPTVAGTKHLTGTLSVRRVGHAILAEVRFPTAHSVLAGGLVPIDGNCVLAPLRKVRVTVTGLLAGT